jgi:hypothetical protein
MKSLLILWLIVVSSVSATALAHTVEGIKLNNLVNCKSITLRRGHIAERLLRGENRIWIQSDSVTKMVKSMDTVSGSIYPFKILSDVYIIPEGYLAFISINPTDPVDEPRITFFSFQEFGPESGFFLRANSLEISKNGSKVILGDGSELNCDQIE